MLPRTVEPEANAPPLTAFNQLPRVAGRRLRSRGVARLSALSRLKVPDRQEDSRTQYQGSADAVDEARSVRSDPCCGSDGEVSPGKQNDPVDKQVGSAENHLVARAVAPRHRHG